jgi:hypothetical protein
LFDDRVNDRTSNAGLVECGARFNCCLRITRRHRPAILRLQEVDVAATGEVEGVARWAEEHAIVTREWQSAAAYAARERRVGHLLHARSSDSVALALFGLNARASLRPSTLHASTSDVTHNAVPPSISVITTMSQSGR